MPTIRVLLLAAALALGARAAAALVEPETGLAYPDTVVVETPAGGATLRATGVGLREKTIMKVDVYVIAAWIDASADLGEEPAAAMVALAAPKRLQMDLRRSFARDKLVASMVKAMAANFPDTAPYAAPLDTFLAYFAHDARDGDRIVFDYAPGRGLVTSLNGDVCGTIASPAFTQALWSVWFGEHAADDHLRRALLARAAPAAAARP